MSKSKDQCWLLPRPLPEEPGNNLKLVQRIKKKGGAFILADSNI